MKPNHSSIVIATHEGISFLIPEEIVRLEASSNYTLIYFADKSKMVTSKVLRRFADMLEPMGFVRTHRTHLVNPKYIASITHKGNIIMRDESVAYISKRLKQDVLRKLCNAA